MTESWQTIHTSFRVSKPAAVSINREHMHFHVSYKFSVIVIQYVPSSAGFVVYVTANWLVTYFSSVHQPNENRYIETAVIYLTFQMHSDHIHSFLSLITMIRYCLAILMFPYNSERATVFKIEVK